MEEDEVRRDYQLISNTICTFVDFMKIRAPSVDLESSVIKFYFKLFLEWLENFSLNIFDIPLNLQLKFDYILDRLGKSNLLSLMINIEMEDQIRNVIQLLMRIEGDKRYSEQSSNFQNIYLIIKGLLEEVRNITIPMLNDILINYKRKLNPEKFQLSSLIMFEMKNILSTPTNQLIFHLINNDYNSAKDKKQSEILKLVGDEFILFLKNLAKISNEYLINYLSSVPLQESLLLTKTKIKNITHFEILLNIFATKNSLKIAKDYSQLFANFLDCFTQKSTKENDKFKIFKSLLKFLYKNNNSELKKSNLYLTTIDKIKHFLNEVKNEATGINVMNTISEKIQKNKKIPKKILVQTQTFLDNKNQNLVIHATEMNFSIMNKKCFHSVSIFDLFSEEKRKKIKKLSFLLNNLLIKYVNSENSTLFKKEFNEKLLDLLHRSEDKPKTFILLFYISLTNLKAHGALHKFFLDSIDIFCVFVKYFQLSYEENSNLVVSPNNFQNSQKSSKVFHQIETSKNKLEKESKIFRLLEDIYSDENSRENFMNLFDPEIKNKSEILNSIINKFSNYSQDEIHLIKKAFSVQFEKNEINSIVDFGVLLLNNFDEDNQNAHEYLQCVLSIFFYYLKLNSSHLILKSENNDDTRTSLVFVEETSLMIFNNILDFIKRILISKIKSKEIMNYAIVIMKNMIHLKIQKLTDKIKNLVLHDLSSFSLENYEISIKPLARLFHDLNKSELFEDFLFPENFDCFLYESDKKLSAVKFINEYLKLDRKNNILNEIVFKDSYRIFILEDLKNADENLYEQLLNQVIENPDDTIVKKNLINLMCMKHEILKYEFYYLFVNDSNIKTSHERFIKNIFNKLYELSNFQEEMVENFLSSKKKSGRKSYEVSEKEQSEYEKEEASESNSSQEFNKKSKIKKIVKQLNNVNIGKYINLVFKHFDNGIIIKPNHQIKLMNFAIYSDIFVRDHLLKKIEKCLKIKKTIYYNLHAIPITMIYLNDPDKVLKKKANYLLAIFLNHLLNKLKESKDSEKHKNKNYLYKYLPETYLSYLLMYFTFNSNLNLIYHCKETKYFQTITQSYLKILKKITNNQYDSNFLIENCVKIKNLSLKNKKVIMKISNDTYLKNIIKTDNYSVTSDHYEFVKNEVCNMIIKMINIEYTTKFKYDEYKPQIPVIFLTEKELSMVMSNLKSERTKEEKIPNFNETVELSKIYQKESNMSYLNYNDSVNNISVSREKNENFSENFGVIKSSIAGLENKQTKQKSNRAVKDYKLRLEPGDVSKSKSIEIEEKDFDEFENLPYYNKYKDREDSQISDKEFEDGLDLNKNNDRDVDMEEDENSHLKPIHISSKKMLDEEDNKIKEFVEEDIEIKGNKKRKSIKKTKVNVDKSKSMKKKKTKK